MDSNPGCPCGRRALTWIRTPAVRVAGEHSTPEPQMLESNEITDGSDQIKIDDQYRCQLHPGCQGQREEQHLCAMIVKLMNIKHTSLTRCLRVGIT